MRGAGLPGVGRILGTTQFRYLMVGAWNTVFGVGLFAVLLHLLDERVSYGWILLVSQVIAVLQSHWSQRTFVWRSREPFGPELARFSGIYVATYFANLALLALLVEVLGWEVMPAQVAITVLLVISTYVVNRVWTFRARPS